MNRTEIGNEQSKKKVSLSGHQVITKFTVETTPSKRFNQMSKSTKTNVKHEFAKKSFHQRHHRNSNSKSSNSVILISDSDTENETSLTEPSTLRESTSKALSQSPSSSAHSTSYITGNSTILSASLSINLHPGSSGILHKAASSSYCSPTISQSTITPSKKTTVLWSTPPINITQDKNVMKPASLHSSPAKSVSSMASEATAPMPQAMISKPQATATNRMSTNSYIAEKADSSRVTVVAPLASESMTPMVEMSPYSKMIATQYLNMLKNTQNGPQYPKTTPGKSSAGSQKDKFGISYALPEPLMPIRHKTGEKRPKKFSEYLKRGENLSKPLQKSLTDENRNFLVSKVQVKLQNKSSTQEDLSNITSKTEKKSNRMLSNYFDLTKKKEKVEQSSASFRLDSKATPTSDEENVPENLEESKGHRSKFFELLKKKKTMVCQPVTVSGIPVSHSGSRKSSPGKCRKTSDSSSTSSTGETRDPSPVLICKSRRSRMQESARSHDFEGHPNKSKTVGIQGSGQSQSSSQISFFRSKQHLADSISSGNTEECEISSLGSRLQYSKGRSDKESPSSIPSSRSRQQLQKQDSDLDPLDDYDDIENRQQSSKRRKTVGTSFLRSVLQHPDQDVNSLPESHSLYFDDVENQSNNRKTKTEHSSVQPRTLENLHSPKMKEPRTLEKLTSQIKPEPSKPPRSLENLAELIKRNQKIFGAVQVYPKKIGKISVNLRNENLSGERLKSDKTQQKPGALVGEENSKMRTSMKKREIEELLMRNVLDEINRGNSSNLKERMKDCSEISLVPKEKIQKRISDYWRMNNPPTYLIREVGPDGIPRWRPKSNYSAHDIHRRKANYKLQAQNSGKKFFTKSLSQDARDRWEDVENRELTNKFGSEGKYKTKSSNSLKRKFQGGIPISTEVKRARTLNQIERDDEKISSMLKKVLSERKKPGEGGKNLPGTPKSKRSLFPSSTSIPLEPPAKWKFSSLKNFPDSMKKTRNILNYKTKQSELDILRMRKQQKLLERNCKLSNQEKDYQEILRSDSSSVSLVIKEKAKQKDHPAKEATDRIKSDRRISTESCIKIGHLYQNNDMRKYQDDNLPIGDSELDLKPGEHVKEYAGHKDHFLPDSFSVYPEKDAAKSSNDVNKETGQDAGDSDDDVIFVCDGSVIDLTKDSESDEEYEEGVDQDALQDEIHHKGVDRDAVLKEHLKNEEANQYSNQEESVVTQSSSLILISDAGIDEDFSGNFVQINSSQEDKHPGVESLKDTVNDEDVTTELGILSSLGRMQESSRTATLERSCLSPDLFESDVDEKENGMVVDVCSSDESSKNIEILKYEDDILKMQQEEATAENVLPDAGVRLSQDVEEIKSSNSGVKTSLQDNKDDLPHVQVDSEDSQKKVTLQDLEDEDVLQVIGLTATESQDAILDFEEKQSSTVDQEALDAGISPMEIDQEEKQLDVGDKGDSALLSTCLDLKEQDDCLPGDDQGIDSEVYSGEARENSLAKVSRMSLESSQELEDSLRKEDLCDTGELKDDSSKDLMCLLQKEEQNNSLDDAGGGKGGSEDSLHSKDDQEKDLGREGIGEKEMEDQIFQEVSAALEAALSITSKDKDAPESSSSIPKQHDLENSKCTENKDLENAEDDLPEFSSLKIAKTHTSTPDKAKASGKRPENDLQTASYDFATDKGEGSKEQDILFSVNDFFDDVSTAGDEVYKSSVDLTEDFPQFEYEKDDNEVKVQGEPSRTEDKEEKTEEKTSERPTSERSKKGEQSSKIRDSRRSRDLATQENKMTHLLNQTLLENVESTSTVYEELESFSLRPAPLTPRLAKKRFNSDRSPAELSPRTVMILNEAQFQTSYKKHKLSIARLVRQKKKECEVDKMEEILLSDLKQGGFRTTLEKHEVADECDDEDVPDDEAEDDDTKRTLKLLREDWGTLPILQVDSNVFDNQRPLLCYHSMSLKNQFDDTSLSMLPRTNKEIVSSCLSTNFSHYSDTLTFLMNDKTTKKQTWSWMLKLLCYHPNCRTVEEIIQSELRRKKIDQSPLSYNDLKSCLLYSGVRSSAFDEPLQNQTKDKSEITICEKCLMDRKMKRRSLENLKRVLNIINIVILSFPGLFTSDQRTEFCKVFLQLFTDIRLPNLTADVLRSFNIVLDSFNDWPTRKVLLSRDIVTLFPKLHVIQEIADALRYCQRGLDLSRLIAFSVLKIHAVGENIETMIIDDRYDIQAVVDLVENLDPGNLETYLKPQAVDEPQMASQKRSFYFLSLLLPLLDICIGHDCAGTYTAVVLERITSMLRTINKRIRDNGAIYRSQMKYELSLFVKNLRSMIQKAPKITQSSIFKYLRSAPVHEELVHETDITDADNKEEEEIVSGNGELTYNDGDDEAHDKGQTTPKSSSILGDELEIAQVIRERIFGSGVKS